MFKKLIIGLGVSTLLVAVVFQVVRYNQTPPPPNFDGDLKTAIPQSMPGWEVKDRELGATESLQERSENLLQLDQYVHREFDNGRLGFNVFVAYWTPGKMPVRLVNQHSPDRCWTETGFTCSARQWNIVPFESFADLQPAQWGTFEKDEVSLNTYFWHIVNGKAHWYREGSMNTRSSLASVWIDFKKFGFNVYREQFFVRLTSSHSFDELKNEEAFQKVIQDLAALCLEPKGEGKGKE